MLEKLKTYRSIRKYEEKPVGDEVLKTLLGAALLAPSSRGLRSWEFVVVTDPDLKNKLSKAKIGGGGFLKDAPVVVVVVADSAISDVWVEDCSIAAYTIQLCARDQGLGSCWAQIRLRKDGDGVDAEENVRQILQIPAKYSVDSIIAIGYPAEEKDPYTQADMDWTKIHYNSY